MLGSPKAPWHFPMESLDLGDRGNSKTQFGELSLALEKVQIPKIYTQQHLLPYTFIFQGRFQKYPRFCYSVHSGLEGSSEQKKCPQGLTYTTIN